MTDAVAPDHLDQADQPPLELSLHFITSDSDQGPLRVSAQVQQLGLDAGPIEFAVPLDKKVMADLHWYLEVYPRWPVGPDYKRALEIEARLRGWGEALFDAVFADRKMMRVYDGFLDSRAAGHLLTVDAGPRVLSLPWELLADEGGYLFT